jgi:hypothetical protein
MQNRVNGEQTMRKPLSLIVLLGLSAAAFGQTAPPALMVKVDGKSQPLGLTKLDTNVRIYGYLAETTTTMTFLNLLDRVMEGDLYFPLPEGSTISGYALDIEGKNDRRRGGRKGQGPSGLREDRAAGHRPRSDRMDQRQQLQDPRVPHPRQGHPHHSCELRVRNRRRGRRRARRLPAAAQVQG